LVPYTKPHNFSEFESAETAFRVDTKGRLIIDEQLKDYLNFFLLTVANNAGEVEAIAYLLTNIEKLLPETEKGKALDILTRYLSSIKAETEYTKSILPSTYEGDIKSLSKDIHNDVIKFHEISHKIDMDIRSIREEFLGEELNSAFYKRENQLKDMDYKVKLSSLDKGLSTEEKIEKVFKTYNLDKGNKNTKSIYYNIDQEFIAHNNELDDSEKKRLRKLYFNNIIK
jgi:lipase chaperone LimK